MAMHYRLLEAYFSENRTISDWEVLAELVSEIGEDPLTSLRKSMNARVISQVSQ